MAAGKAQGLFFGLPTMATANAMYDRLVKTWLAFYSPESRPSLVLAHSARTLMDRFNESLWSGDLVGSEEPDEQTFSQGCAAWFADSNKKALLAEIGVGTLDQAMMAVMPFKHNNLRGLIHSAQSCSRGSTTCHSAYNQYFFHLYTILHFIVERIKFCVYSNIGSEIIL